MSIIIIITVMDEYVARSRIELLLNQLDYGMIYWKINNFICVIAAAPINY